MPRLGRGTEDQRVSIATSRAEQEAARAKLAAAPAEQIERDLAFWSVAKVDHAKNHARLTAERQEVAELYGEADAWIDLIAEELHRRRTADPGR